MKELDLLEQYLSASPEQRRTIASPGGISFMNAGIVSPQNQAAAVMPSAEGQRMPIMKDSAKGVPSYLMKNEDYAKSIEPKTTSAYSKYKIPNTISREYTPTVEDKIMAPIFKNSFVEPGYQAQRQEVVAPLEEIQLQTKPAPQVVKPKMVMKKPIPKAAQSIAAASIPVAPPAPEPVAEVIQPPTPEPVFELPPATEPETSIVDKYNEGMGRAALKSDIDRMANDAMIDKLSEPSDLRNSLNDKVLEFALNSKKFEPSRDYNADIDRLNKESQALKGTNDGDMWSHLIYSLGAPLLGALTGSAGALAAPKAQADIDKESQMHWKARAQMRSKLEDSISKRMNAIKGLRSEEFDNNFKEQDALLKKYQLLNEVVKGADLTQKDQFDKYMTLKNNLDMEAAKAGFAAPKTAAEIEQKSIDEQGRNAREIDKLDATKWRDQQKALEDTKKLKAQQEYDAKKRKEYQEWMSAEKEKDRKNRMETQKLYGGSQPYNRQENADDRYHKDVITRLDNNTTFKRLQDNAVNLGAAKKIIKNPNIVKSPQILHELQTVMQNGMGLNKRTDMQTRLSQDQVQGLGISLSKLENWLFTKPTEANAPEIIDHLSKIIDNEKAVVGLYASSYLNGIVEGHKHWYDKRPEYKKSLMGFLENRIETLGGKYLEEDDAKKGYSPSPTKPLSEMTRKEKEELIKSRGGK